MSYDFYKVLHMVGVLTLFYALGALTLLFFKKEGRKHKYYRVIMVTHGIGLIVTLVSGFGILAKIGITWPWPLWVWLLVGVWLFLGAVVPIFRRRPEFAMRLWGILLVLIILSSYLGHYKPD